jgi:hypothetical protein
MRSVKLLTAANATFQTGADVLRRQESNCGFLPNSGSQQQLPPRPPPGGGFEMLKDVVEMRAARNAKIDDLIAEHQNLAHELVGRQRLEAGNLAAHQSRQLGKRVEPVPVDFPFEDAFHQARRKAAGA